MAEAARITLPHVLRLTDEPALPLGGDSDPTATADNSLHGDSNNIPWHLSVCMLEYMDSLLYLAQAHS